MNPSRACPEAVLIIRPEPCLIMILEAAWQQKRAQLPARLFNATLASDESENALVITGGVVVEYWDRSSGRTLQISAQRGVAFLEPSGTVIVLISLAAALSVLVTAAVHTALGTQFSLPALTGEMPRSTTTSCRSLVGM